MRTDGYGKCKFCGQMRAVFGVPEDATQPQLDAIATDECDCEGAEKERDVRELANKAAVSIAKVVSRRSSDAAVILQAAAQAVARRYVKKVSVNVDGMLTASMYFKDGKIVVECRKTETYISDGEMADDSAEPEESKENTEI